MPDLLSGIALRARPLFVLLLLAASAVVEAAGKRWC
jgi:hypothetical protein